MSLFRQKFGNLRLPDLQIVLILQYLAHGFGIGSFVRLGPQRMHSGSLRDIQHLRLNKGLINVFAHFAAQGIDLPHQMSLGGSADMGIAGHHGDTVRIHGKDHRFKSQSGTGQCRLASRMSCSDYTDICIYMVFILSSRHSSPHSAGPFRRRNCKTNRNHSAPSRFFFEKPRCARCRTEKNFMICFTIGAICDACGTNSCAKKDLRSYSTPVVFFTLISIYVFRPTFTFQGRIWKRSPPPGHHPPVLPGSLPVLYIHSSDQWKRNLRSYRSLYSARPVAEKNLP